MYRILILILAYILFSSTVSTLESQKDSTDEISICRVEYTELGKYLTWHGYVVYKIITDSLGTVVDLSIDEGPTFGDVLKLEQLENCIRTWKLTLSGVYTFTFRHEITGDNSYELTGPDNNPDLKICLFPIIDK